MSVPLSERRIVSVLFAEVSASTAIGERRPSPERSRFLFDEAARYIEDVAPSR